MKINATIRQVLEPVNGKNQNGEYKFIPIIIDWKEQVIKRDGTCFDVDHSQIVHVMGAMAQNFSLAPGTRVNIDLRFSAREYEGRIFNSVSTNYITYA